jgi:hypothetical protein
MQTKSSEGTASATGGLSPRTPRARGRPLGGSPGKGDAELDEWDGLDLAQPFSVRDHAGVPIEPPEHVQHRLGEGIPILLRDRVLGPLPIPPILDESGVVKDGKMLGDSRGCEAEHPLDLAHAEPTTLQ